MGGERLMRALRAIANLADPLIAVAVTSLHARAVRGSSVARLMLAATVATVRRAASS
jgi:hypothetical protein